MVKKVTVADFLNTDFREFSLYDCHINVPSMIDGLKVSQRKAMWAVLNHAKVMTVEQLASLASSYTKYHHGSTSLESVITGVAQTFTGSNNVNWLLPDGQFGNILNNKASSARYISASLNPNWRAWFKKEDDIITEFVMEDGDVTEPQYFIPIVPTILFNGSSGIGTGYSTSILSYNPKDVVANVKLSISGKPLAHMTPWYDGYKGTIEKAERQTTYKGVFERVNATSIKITQLPIGYDLDSYKEVLGKLIDTNEIKDYDDMSTESGWNIIVYATREWIKQHESILVDRLKLISRDSENFVVWDENQRIRRFSNPNELIQHFVNWRIKKYEDRRLKQIELLKLDIDWLIEKQRFIQYFIANSRDFVKMSKDDIQAKLKELECKEIDKLLQIRVYNMTKDEIQKLNDEIAVVQKNVDTLAGSTAQDMYLKDLKG